MLPDSIAKPASPVPESEKSDFRKIAEGGWEQVTIAAKGVGQAAVTVGTAVSGSAHKAVEHNFGKEAEGVAQGECRGLVFDPRVGLLDVADECRCRTGWSQCRFHRYVGFRGDQRYYPYQECRSRHSGLPNCLEI
jgi:hypothetical protein